MKGIVLAGGKATRLPNKPLLPMHNGKPVITSGIDFLWHNGVREITVVVPPRSPIKHVLRMWYDRHIDYVVQWEPLGVPQAIAIGAQDEPVLVVFCDNVYSLVRSTIPDLTGHTVMTVDDPIKARDLSKYDGERSAFVHEAASTICLAGFMVVQPDALAVAHHFKDNITFLNAVGAVPFTWSDDEWWDLGTADAYRRYWETFQ